MIRQPERGITERSSGEIAEPRILMPHEGVLSRLPRLLHEPGEGSRGEVMRFGLHNTLPNNPRL